VIHTNKPQTDFVHFSVLDMRVGKIISVDDSKAKKPTYKITVDFGSETGIKTTIGAFKNYQKEELIGKLVVGLVNVGEKKMGEEISQFLLMGVPNEKHETIYLMPESEVPLGVEVF
jgi:tRNA-binding protein